MDRCGGRCIGRCRGVSLSVFTSTKRFYRKGTEEPEITKTQNEHEKKSRYFKAVSTVRGTFWAISSVGGTVLAVSRVGATLLAVLRVGGTFWRYLELAVLFLAEAVKPKHGGIFSAVMQYGGNVLAGGGF